MENLIVYPENENQLKLLKTFLEEMKIRFKKDSEVEELQDWQKEKLLKGIEEADKGDFFTEDEAKKIIDKCFQ